MLFSIFNYSYGFLIGVVEGTSTGLGTYILSSKISYYFSYYSSETNRVVIFGVIFLLISIK